MHNGSQAFNADPENARLADDYAIVMGSSHCEQMLRNNEDHWYYTPGMAASVCTEELLEQVRKGPEPGFLNAADALADGVMIESRTEGEIPLWIHALTPVENFSKAAEDNIFCMVNINDHSFMASATPINNIWHSPICMSTKAETRDMQ